jgi:hypothetical protein
VVICNGGDINYGKVMKKSEFYYYTGVLDLAGKWEFGIAGRTDG